MREIEGLIEMDEKRLIRISKYLSKYLRHQPESIGLKLSPGGWVETDELLKACRLNGFSFSREELEETVARNNKKRFSFDPTGTKIRANQGHSAEVDLLLEPTEPPAVLYHGTAERNLEAIMATGLRKMARHHVHLSKEVETARTVGARHGKPIVFEVDAAEMARAGHLFYVSDNGVWLADEVPPQYMKKI